MDGWNESAAREHERRAAGDASRGAVYVCVCIFVCACHHQVVDSVFELGGSLVGRAELLS
jgi:hypothetical protein